MPDEIYDIVDDNGNKIGTASWTDVHTKGLLHQCASALIFKDTSRQETLLQRRSLSMNQCPGLWQHAAGGHILADQTSDQGIRQELQEELFYKHELPQLEIKKIVTFYNHDLPNNHELLTLYEVIYPGPFFPDPKEVDTEPQWIRWEALLIDLKTNPAKYTTAFHNIMRAYLNSLKTKY